MTVGRVAAAIATHTAAQDRQLARGRSRGTWRCQFVARHPSRLKADLAYEGFLKGAGKPGFDDALRACLDYDFRDRLPEIGCPTLIVWGEKDSIIPVKDAARVRAPDPRQPQGRDGGHRPRAMVERPATFNDLLMEFLAEAGAAADKRVRRGRVAGRLTAA